MMPLTGGGDTLGGLIRWLATESISRSVPLRLSLWSQGQPGTVIGSAKACLRSRRLRPPPKCWLRQTLRPKVPHLV